MTRSKYNLTAVFLLLPCVCGAQIISSLNGENILPGNESNNIISDVSDPDTLQSQFLDWNCILGEFSETVTISQKELQEEISQLPASSNREMRHCRLNGQDLDLPSNYDENGTDLYMLTDEGITIYMALLAPAYYQETTPDIIRWIRYYAYNNRKRTEKMFRRYEQWHQFIRTAFEQRGIPPEMAEICLIESACTYRALSPVGAYGMWQLMPDTARQWGLTVNETKDEREDPLTATITAAKVLNQSYTIIKDWTLCAAGYNCGIGRVQRITGRYGTDWLSIKDKFPKETQQYIPSLLAIHYVWSYRIQLGFKN